MEQKCFRNAIGEPVPLIFDPGFSKSNVQNIEKFTWGTGSQRLELTSRQLWTKENWAEGLGELVPMYWNSVPKDKMRTGRNRGNWGTGSQMVELDSHMPE